MSRDWSGKTLADHRADARAWVRRLLGVSTGADDADPVHQDDAPAYAWEMARPDPDPCNTGCSKRCPNAPNGKPHS